MHNLLGDVRASLQAVFRGSPQIIDFSMAAFLAGGHLLLEGLPGAGKTLLARALAQAFGGEFRRIQMTSDLLPSDIVGIVRLKPGSGEFEFRKGPIFANVVLADELNRTPPKTQSALLEAMAESTVSVDGITHLLPNPFFVVATQNPLDSHGVYPLAESQLDRFMLKLFIERPSLEEEILIYENSAIGKDRHGSQLSLQTKMSIEQALELRARVRNVRVDPKICQYAAIIVRQCGKLKQVSSGPSIRAGQQLLSCAQALAYLRGREFVSPKEVHDLSVAALAHRLFLGEEEMSAQERNALISQVLEQVKPPA